MPRFKSLLAIWAILSAAVSAKADVPALPQVGTDRVAITQVSDDPGVGSGIVAFAVKVSGQTLGGERSYFIPFMAENQAKPHVGEVCDIDWRWFAGGFRWLLANGEQISSGREVRTFHCGPGPS